MGENVHKSTKTSGYAAKNDTEGGLTRDQRARVLDWENRHADDADESMAAIDKYGNIRIELKGKGSSVKTNKNTDLSVFKDAILTHNHPGKFRKDTSPGSSANRIGGMPFSATDLNTAITNNALGIRARTSNYVFSIQRGKNGWGKADAKDYAKIMNEWQRHFKDGETMTHQQNADRWYRNQIAGLHQALKKFAADNGLVYTRRKVR